MKDMWANLVAILEAVTDTEKLGYGDAPVIQMRHRIVREALQV